VNLGSPAFFNSNFLGLAMSIKLQLIAIVALLLCVKTLAADNLVLVTLDGLRWQEVFRGLDKEILMSTEANEAKQLVTERFSGDSEQEKRQNLMPFLWERIAKQGLIIGNRDKNSYMEVSNGKWFSYPGYNELLTGKADPRIDSNEAKPNPNISFLEWLQKRPTFVNKVAAFASWDLFPYILNVERSHLLVNSGFMPANWATPSSKALWLNDLQGQIPSPWHNVRLDAFTMAYATEYLLQYQPKMIYISLGETDDFAHDGNYPAYLSAARRDDQLIANLWQQLQELPEYRNNTNLIISVDHGRGLGKDAWMHHGSPEAVNAYLKAKSGEEQNSPGIVGSNEVWLAAMGPDIPAKGELVDTPKRYSNQIAASILTLLNQNAELFSKGIGAPLPELTKQP
jgi:hypothetical protein